MSKQTKHCFSVVYDEYILFSKERLKQQSYQSLIYKFRKHILPFFKDYYLEDITKLVILEWKESVISKNFSNNYNTSLYYLLSAFFEYCKNNYNFDKTIFSSVGCFKKKYEEDKHDFYTLEEFNKFIKYVKEEKYKQFFNFMFYTGTRPGEAMAITFKDIQGEYVIINKTISSHNGRHIGTPKTNSSYRSIIIDDRLKSDLLNLKKLYKNCTDNFFVFGGDKPLSPTTLNRKKIYACKKANLRPITLHQFRHSHATLLKDIGINVVDVSKRLGHSKVSTTLNIYTHTDYRNEKRVQSTLNSVRFNFFQCFNRYYKKLKSILKRPK